MKGGGEIEQRFVVRQSVRPRHFIRTTLTLIWILAFLPCTGISDLYFIQNVAMRKIIPDNISALIVIKSTRVWTTD